MNPLRLGPLAAIHRLDHGHAGAHHLPIKSGGSSAAAGRQTGLVHALRPRVPPNRHRARVAGGDLGEESGWNAARDADGLSTDAGSPVEAPFRRQGQEGQDHRDEAEADDEGDDSDAVCGASRATGQAAALARWMAKHPPAQREWRQASQWLDAQPTVADVSQDVLRRLHEGVAISRDLRLAALAGLLWPPHRPMHDVSDWPAVVALLHRTALRQATVPRQLTASQTAALLLLPLILLNWSRPRSAAERIQAAQRLLLTGSLG